MRKPSPTDTVSLVLGLGERNGAEIPPREEGRGGGMKGEGRKAEKGREKGEERNSEETSLLWGPWKGELGQRVEVRPSRWRWALSEPQGL